MILFRCEGNEKIGLGHLYRIKSITQYLNNEISYKIILDNNSNHRLFENKKDIIFVKNLSDEIKKLKSLFTRNFKLIIIDGYNFDIQYQQRISKIGFKILLIDDLYSNVLYADYVINHSLEANKKKYKNSKQTKFFLGSTYALIRKDFQSTLKNEQDKGVLNNIFLCFGGSDPLNLSQKIASILLKLTNINKIFMLLGESYNHHLSNTFLNNNQILIYKNLDAKEIIKIMKNSKLAILPSSTILFEACSVGLPVITGYYAKNQKNIYNDITKNGLAIGIGDLNHKIEKPLLKFVNQLVNDANLRGNLVNQQQFFFDGMSHKRINKLIQKII